MPPLTELQVRQIIREELQRFILSDRYAFEKHLQIFDGKNIQLAKGTGTKIGTESTQKMAFFGATPVVRQASISAPSTPSGAYVQAEAVSTVAAINSIRTALITFGLTS